MKYRFVHLNRTRHGKVRYYLRRPGMKLIRLPDMEVDEAEFRRQYHRAMYGERPDYIAAERERSIAAVYNSARKRAGDKGLPFTVTKVWLRDKIAAQGDRCSLTGLAFDYSERPTNRAHFKRSHAPSMDRIQNALGYTPENCRVVLCCVNIAINEWGLENFLEVSAAALERIKEERNDTRGVAVDARVSVDLH